MRLLPPARQHHGPEVAAPRQIMLLLCCGLRLDTLWCRVSDRGKHMVLRMRTRTFIGVALVAGIVGAIHAEDLAAAYVAVVGASVIYLLHAIEFKMNKLL